MRCRLLFATLLLAGCVAGPNRSPTGAGDARQDGPPQRLSAAQYQALLSQPDPVPRQEPPSERGNPPQYSVFGKTYRLLPTAVGYTATGNASWYGRKFHGRLTSSGEPFDMFALTAAHRSLPIPNYLEVTNLDNGRRTIVRVNDRGPFHDDRVLDLSFAAAVKLGFSQTGTAPVRIRTLSGAGPEPAPAPGPRTVPPPQPQSEVFWVQVGAFGAESGARTLKRQLTALPALEHPVQIAAVDGWYRVRVGPLPSVEAAEIIKWDLVRADFRNTLVLAEERVTDSATPRAQTIPGNRAADGCQSLC
ncbi:MAG: septal ring lytic transglycosylase RlpA family protein [Pseudomonadota bacterium]